MKNAIPKPKTKEVFLLQEISASHRREKIIKEMKQFFAKKN